MPQALDNILPFVRYGRLDERLQLVLDSLPVGISWADIRTQKIEFVNRYFVDTFGYTQDDIRTVPEFLALSQANPEAQREALKNIDPDTLLRNPGSVDLGQSEVEVRCKDGAFKTVIFGGIALPDVGWTVATFLDITERKQNEARITRLSETDALTSLLNRRSFDEVLLDSVQSAENNGDTYVLLIDLDGFKQVNDEAGHQAGDEILVHVARRLSLTLRAGDSLARWGGDEFAAILPPPATSAHARRVVQRIEDVFKSPFTVDGRQIKVGASVGMACYPRDASNAHDLYRCADDAMYEAKRLKKESRRKRQG